MPHPTPDAPLTRDELVDYYRRRGIITLQSRQLLIEPAVERAALDVAKEMGLRAVPTLVYLANSISHGEQAIPYSVVAAVDPGDPAVAGRLPARDTRSDDEILLVEWPESPLKAKPGDAITLTLLRPEQEGRLKERTATFRLRGFVPLTARPADPDLTPEFPGITDKLDLRDWDPPFPYDNSRIEPARRGLLGEVPHHAEGVRDAGRGPEAVRQPFRRTHVDPARCRRRHATWMRRPRSSASAC